MLSKAQFIQSILAAITVVVVSSCVPKATETKAICKDGEGFDSVSRTCYKLEVPVRYKPVGTKSSESVAFQTTKEVTLTYTDLNKDQALSCRVAGIESKIEMISPNMVEGTVYLKSDEIASIATTMAGYFLAPELATATTLASEISQAALNAKNSNYVPTVINQYEIFKVKLQALQSLVPNQPSNLTVQNFSTAMAERIEQFDDLFTSTKNRCDCVAGVCKTYILPKMQVSGTSGFTYFVSDIDGEGAGKNVTVSISSGSSSGAYQRPVVSSTFVQYNESNTSAAPIYSFPVPLATDLLGSSSWTYVYDGPANGNTTNGRIYGCLGIGGSQGTACSYVPNSGDTYNTLTPATASLGTLDDIVFTARAHGTAGNSITVQYFPTESLVTRPQIFAMVSGISEGFVRVEGDAIKVYVNPDITTTANIVQLINAHALASRLVIASGGSIMLPYMSNHTSANSLSGGVDGFDTVRVKAINSSGVISTNTAIVSISMLPVNDFPIVPVTDSTLNVHTEAMLEDTAKSFNISFRDVDSFASNFIINAKVEAPTTLGCVSNLTTAEYNVLVTSPYFTLGGLASATATCTGTGSCTRNITVTPNSNFFGRACLYYQIQDSGGLTSAYQLVTLEVAGINNAPVITGVPGAPVSIFEDLDGSATAYTGLNIGPGGNGFESAQKLTVTATSAHPALIPNQACINYVPGNGTPVSTVTPTGTGSYYFDVTAGICYVSTGVTNTSWKLYPSLTAYPNCAYGVYGQGTPVGVVVPSSVGARYLDTRNNLCYVATGTTSSAWNQDTSLTSYRISYVPMEDQSGATTITVTAKDDGGVTNGGVDTTTASFDLNVQFVDDPAHFISYPTLVQTNEGGKVQSDAFYVDEDKGSTVSEDYQPVRVVAIFSDNPAVLPVSGISLFYDANLNGVEDAGEARAIGTSAVANTILEGNAALDVSDAPFYLKLNPVAGVAGNSNITVRISDQNDGSNYKEVSFSFIVHSVAALHGGWTNISSVGIKTDKKNAPVHVTTDISGVILADSEIQCNYNKSTDVNKCSTTSGDCTGAGSPHSVYTPTSAGAIFWDSSNKRCYRSTGSTSFTWVEFNTSCPVTRSASACAGENCLYPDTFDPATADPATLVAGLYYYDTTDNTCHVRTAKAAPNDWLEYVPSKVTLSWEPFMMTGSGSSSSASIKGWNIYRREAGFDYDFRGGHLKVASSTDKMTITSSTTRTFTDTTAVAGVVYYYVVRPVDTLREIPTYTAEIFSEVRVLAAPANTSFVHRWMVNQEICRGMKMTSTTPNAIDAARNFSCPYIGPGSVSGRFDYGKDLLVDTYEAGCPYAAAPKCSGDGCLGIGAPSSTVNVVQDDLYYDRQNGACYVYSGATWLTANASAIRAAFSNKVNSALNAPLVNVSQTQAMNICQGRTIASTAGVSLAASDVITPSKLDYTVIAAHRTDKSNYELSVLEEGSSLNGESRCNSSNASGLTSGFTDSAVPSTSLIYTLPGTLGSGIRSLYTGSIAWGANKGTEACVSRYGIQDLYGNVAEWTNDRMACTSNASTPGYTVCDTDNDTAFGSFKTGDYDSALTTGYTLDGEVGPFNDISLPIGPSAGDGYLSTWTLSERLFGAGKFSFPVGLPISETVDPALQSFPWLLDIGPSSGISAEALHDDHIIVENQNLTGIVSGIVAGGSYKSGMGAGRFATEFVPTATTRSDIGFRCIVPIEKNQYLLPDSLHTYPY